MKIIIFAGGKGTRMWPLSRDNSPKQFDKIFNGKSTIQLAMERVEPTFGASNIFVQTIAKYRDAIVSQLPKLPKDNVIIEPERRNVGPAVCLAMLELKKRGYTGAVAIIWADHLMERPEEFSAALKAGESLIGENPERFIFIGEKPRFANNNLGWIHVGNRAGTINDKEYFSFLGWKYKPEQEACVSMYEGGRYLWNPGYFITSVEFLLRQYRELAPDIYTNVAGGNYVQAEATHFDRAIIEKVDLSRAAVLKTDMGWSDPGTLYALKEALEESSEANVIQGKVIELDSRDCLLYNFEDKKLMAAVGLEGTVVVNTKESLLIAPKEQVVKITALLEKIKAEGLGQYL